MKASIKELLEKKTEINYITAFVAVQLYKVSYTKNINGQMIDIDENKKAIFFSSYDRLVFWIQQRTLFPAKTIRKELLHLKINGFWNYDEDSMKVIFKRPISDLEIPSRFFQTEIPDYMCKEFVLKNGHKIKWNILHQMIYNDIDSYENSTSTPYIPINEAGQLTERMYYKSLRRICRECKISFYNAVTVMKDIDAIFHGRRWDKEGREKRVHCYSSSKRTSVVARRNLHEYILKFQEEECQEVKILRLKKEKIEKDEMIKVEFKTGVERKYTVNQERKQEKEEELNEIRQENKEKQIESAKKFKKLSQDLNHKCSAEIPMSIKKNVDLMNEFIKKTKEELLKKFKTLKVSDVIKKKIVFWQYCKYKIKEYLHIPQYITETKEDLQNINYIWNNLSMC